MIFVLGKLGHSRSSTLCPPPLRCSSIVKTSSKGTPTSSLWQEAEEILHTKFPGRKRLSMKAKGQGKGQGAQGRCLLTIRRELVPLKHGNTQHLLLQVSDEELAVGVPLGVQSVLDGLGDVALGAHGHLAVRVTLSWRGQSPALLGVSGRVTAPKRLFPLLPSFRPHSNPMLNTQHKIENPEENAHNPASYLNYNIINT